MRKVYLFVLFVSLIILTCSCAQNSKYVEFTTEYEFFTEGRTSNLGWRSNDWVFFEYGDVVYGVIFGHQGGANALPTYQKFSSASYGLSKGQFKYEYGDEITITGFYNATSGFGNFSFEGAMTRKELGHPNLIRPIYVTNPERVVELCDHIDNFVYVDCVSRSTKKIAISREIDACDDVPDKDKCLNQLSTTILQKYGWSDAIRVCERISDGEMEEECKENLRWFV